MVGALPLLIGMTRGYVRSPPDLPRLALSLIGLALAGFMVTYLPFSPSTHRTESGTIDTCYREHHNSGHANNSTFCDITLDDGTALARKSGFYRRNEGDRVTMIQTSTGWRRANNVDDTLGYAGAVVVFGMYGLTGVLLAGRHYLRRSRPAEAQPDH